MLQLTDANHRGQLVAGSRALYQKGNNLPGNLAPGGLLLKNQRTFNTTRIQQTQWNATTQTITKFEWKRFTISNNTMQRGRVVWALVF